MKSHSQILAIIALTLIAATIVPSRHAAAADNPTAPVTVKIDNKEVKNYLYTAREADALLKGGVQQIYLGNLKVGKHELVAFFTGKGPVDRAYKRGATIMFDKGVGAKYLELKITDHLAKHQPEFTIKDWE